MTPTLEDAIILAARAHAGQKDKGGEPYILHPLRVMGGVTGQQERIVAVLHDVVEDTEITLEQLREFGYDDETVNAIDHLSRRSGEKYFDFIRRTLNNALACRVKRADLMDNMRPERLRGLGRGSGSMLKKYRDALAMVDEAGARQ